MGDAEASTPTAVTPPVLDDLPASPRPGTKLVCCVVIPSLSPSIFGFVHLILGCGEVCLYVGRWVWVVWGVCVCGQVDVGRWMWEGGCGKVDVGRWMWEGGCGKVDVGRWMWEVDVK